MHKVAVFYHCHPINNGIANLTYFLEKGYREDVDFFIACVDFEPPANVNNVKFFKVENDSHDFGGFSRLLNDIDIPQYDFFGFFNSSSLGPVFNPKEKSNWLDYFLDRFLGDVGICGSTINCLSSYSPHFKFVQNFLDSDKTYYHVQTYSYVLSLQALQTLVDAKFFRWPTKWSKTETILNYELGLTAHLLNHGFNISCLVKEYENIDFRIRSEASKKLEYIGDPCFLGAINGRSLDGNEVLFIKPSRGFRVPG